VSSYYKEYFNSKGKDVYSVDIFDTVLLRNYKSEYFRFYELAKIVKSEFELSIPVQSIFYARVEAARLAYYIYGDKQSKEPSIDYIYTLMFNVLGITPSGELLAKMLSLELLYEKTQLSPNLPLINFLKKKKEQGALIIGISDMYLNSSSIVDLVYSNGEELIFDKLYSSADFKESKREGSLYEIVINDLGLNKDKFIHCGDSYHSDFVMANNYGISAVYTPRTKIWQLRNKLSHYMMLKKMGIA